MNLLTKVSILLISTFSSFSLSSQSIIQLQTNLSNSQELDKVVLQAEQYSIDIDELYSLLNTNKVIELQFPTKNSTNNTLLLEQVNIIAENYSLSTGSGLSTDLKNKYAFYHGRIAEIPNSKVSLTIANKEAHIFISDEIGNYEIHPDKNGLYTGYYEENFLSKNIDDWDCSVEETKETYEEPMKSNTVGSSCVNIFFEVDHNMYNKHGGNVSNVESWVMAMMNQVALLYMEFDVPLNVSGIQVWDVPDPYVGASNTSQALGLFRTAVLQNPNNNGRLAHLLSGRGLGGGIAYLNSLCSSSFNVAVSANLNTSAVTYPNYSWNIMVIAHELGHNFGSKHTHACVWNGDNTAIDGCANTEGSCSQPPIPPVGVGGTIMSYCHLKSTGINFNNGFGPQPGALIRDNYLNANCETGSNCSPVPPFNNYCSRSKEIPVLNHCVNGRYYNHDATPSTSENFTCGNAGDEKDVWFQFTYPDVDSITIQLSSNTGDLENMILELYQGSCQSLSSISCDSMLNGHDISIKIYNNNYLDEIFYIRLVEENSDENGFFNLCVFSEQQACPEIRDSLMNVYYSTTGLNWTNNTGWISADTSDNCNYCEWYGITCNFQGNVTKINLSNNNLVGALNIPYGLESLEEFQLNNNNLSGGIPADWIDFTNLTLLNLSNNNLSDTIPAVFKDLHKIQTLYLDYNNLTGSIPENLGYNGSLRSFSASYNNLSGCFSNGMRSFCYKDSVNVLNNPLLPYNGDVSLLCSNGYGGDSDKDGFCSEIEDCNDYDSTIYPSADEVECDGKDNDCDELVDENSNLGPNIWTGPLSGGSWSDSLNWSMGHPPRVCELVQIGMDASAINLSIIASQESVQLRSLEIGENSSFIVENEAYTQIMGDKGLVNKGSIMIKGYLDIGSNDLETRVGLTNLGSIEIDSMGSIGIYNYNQIGLINESTGTIIAFGYGNVSAYGNTPPLTGIKNEGSLEIHNYFSVYGTFDEEAIQLLDGSTFKLINLGALTTGN